MKLRPIEWVKDGDCFRCTSHSVSGVGYPYTMRNRKHVTIARQILLRRLKELNANTDARHICDNRWCIRPDHIVHGTRAENCNDMVSRGRSRYGARNVNAKLTDDQVREIRLLRQRGLTLLAIAKRFGVSDPLINNICKRVIWKHIN